MIRYAIKLNDIYYHDSLDQEVTTFESLEDAKDVLVLLITGCKILRVEQNLDGNILSETEVNDG